MINNEPGIANYNALCPLCKPWEEPGRFRSRAGDGNTAIITPGRRPSQAQLVPALRHEVAMFRDSGYSGASETTKTLLRHWFETAHPGDFRYHFAQREAIETIIWLYEVARYRSLSAMVSNLLDDTRADFATLLNAINPDTDDAWAKYCCKIATGGGKTKVMSLAIAWSYFHRKFEPDSQLAQHFVVIAPNLTVFERLKDDFAPSEGASIFYTDPLLPPEWKDDFDVQVVLQDDPGGAAASGALYLTNIHRLYSSRDEANGSRDDSPAWAGPDVKRAQALKTGQALRERIAQHPCVMVLNDEAHHVHDDDLAWSEALASLHSQSVTRGQHGVMAQLDFTATPRHNDGTLFRHIVCDFPLGEAVDSGIVKVPVIGKSADLRRNKAAADAFEEYRMHLLLGYKQYERAFTEWKTTCEPILFVMTENTTKANDIWKVLNDDDRFPLLKGKCINLHTKLKGKIKRVRRDNRVVPEFVEDEKAMKPEDLKALRELSRDLDSPDSPYRCVISVLMLREGWDVRNVTTIVPLRPYNADSHILAEQTLGRGLRRMTPFGDGALERVTVVDHEAFSKLYTDELAQEGLDILIEDVDKLHPQTVSIFVDGRKQVADLDIAIPEVSDAIQTVATLDGLSFDMIKGYFSAHFGPLPVKGKSSKPIKFEERALFTDELVASWNIDRGLLSMGFSAVSVFVKELERACRLQNANAILSPLVKRFIEEVLFERPVDLYSGEVDHRMPDQDVLEHIRATFTPLIRQRTTTTTERTRTATSVRLSSWREFQATNSSSKPCVHAEKTLFNLVPCDRGLEREFADFCGIADDVAAFAKNAGPQKLMIDYLARNGRPAFYVPDFFVRSTEGKCYLVEMKGREDSSVSLKAQAGVQWCKTASSRNTPWEYVYAPMSIFEASNDFSVEALALACRPSLKSLLDLPERQQAALSFEETPAEIQEQRTSAVLADVGAPSLPPMLQAPVTEALNLLAFQRGMNYSDFGAAFQPLLVPFEELCGRIVRQRLAPRVPQRSQDQRHYFAPYLDDFASRDRNPLLKNQRLLQRNLVHGDTCNRIGLFLFCVDYANNWHVNAPFVWVDVRDVFSTPEFAAVYPEIAAMYDFRNRHVAHTEEPLSDGNKAEQAMKGWVAGLLKLHALVQ